MIAPQIRVLFLASVAMFMIVDLGCSSSAGIDNDPTASLLLDLTVGDNGEIDVVRWWVSGGDMADMMGTINTGAPGATPSIELFGVPEGTNYLIEMGAISTDGMFTCSGSANFDVLVGAPTPVHVALSCKSECTVLTCDNQTGDCERIDRPDGTRCGNGTGSCLGGACETADI